MPWRLNPFTGQLDYFGVGGPAGGVSTDHAIARWDGVTGALLQNSLVILDDNGNMVMPDDAWIGLGGAGGRIEFDSTPATDEINFLDCRVGIGLSPGALLDVNGSVRFTKPTDSEQQLRFSHSGEVIYIDILTGEATGEIQFRTGEANKNAIRMDKDANIGIGATTFGANAAKTMALALGTDPTGDVANQFAISAFDFAVGNTCPRIRTENGTLVGLNQSLLTTDSPVFNKVRITPIGGIAVRLTNTTGAVTIAGQLVKADPATNDAVILTAGDDLECMGIFLDGGIADDAEAWVVVSGIADVAMQDNTSATRGNWVRVSIIEAGYADGTNLGAPQPINQTHFTEIGHCIETVTATGVGTHILARCVLQFN